MNASDFQFYDGSQTVDGTPRVNVRKGGILVLNKEALEMLGDGVTHVQVGFNPKTNAVGIRPAPADATGRYTLRKPKKGSFRMVNGKRLFQLHGLTVSKARSFNAEKVGDLVAFQWTDSEAADAPETTKKAKVKKA